MFSKSYFFPLFLDNKRNFFETLSEKFRWGCRKWNLQVQRKISATIFLNGYSSIFLGNWAKISWGCARKIFAWFSKLDSHFQRKLSEENFSLCKIHNLFLFWKSSGKNSSDYRKTFRGVSRLLFTSPGELFEENSPWNFFASIVNIFFDDFR